MKTMWKAICAAVGVLLVIGGAVCAIYYWNLDQKFLDWVYGLGKRLRVSEPDAASEEDFVPTA